MPIYSDYYINNSPLSYTLRDMTILKESHILPYAMPTPRVQDRDYSQFSYELATCFHYNYEPAAYNLQI